MQKLRIALIGFAVLLTSLGWMTVFKVLLDGAVTPNCYFMFVEFCQTHCWTGRPFAAFPLKCDRTVDVVITVAANLLSFVIAASSSGFCVYVVVYQCLQRAQDRANRHAYQRQRDAADEEDDEL